MIMKKQMLRIFALILIVLALAFCFSFKGGSENTEIKNSTTAILTTIEEEEITEIETICVTTTEVVKKTNEEIAKEVLAGKWGNNPERKEKLNAAGYDYETIQKIVDKSVPATTKVIKTNKKVSNSGDSSYVSNPRRFISTGVIYYNGYTWTWYSQRVLPGGGLNIPGRHVDSDGFVCDGDGYICLAYHSDCHGMVVNTPFGRLGKVYDTCPEGRMDVYVNW